MQLSTPVGRYLAPHASTTQGRSPSRPGNYYVRQTDGTRVGVATITHFGPGLSGVFIRTLDGVKPRVQTDELRVEFERQDEAWSTALATFGKALGLDPASLAAEV